MNQLTRALDVALAEDARICRHVRRDLIGCLDKLRSSRNAVCHGQWLGITGSGSASFHFHYWEDGIIKSFRRTMSIEKLVEIRAQTVDLIFRISETAGVAGAEFGLAVVSARKHEPRNTPHMS
ncbi:MAG: hypothetical protein OXF74_07120 [Rhodobacteraceae bacterium]|nr:hypothetical protein [Paracoccaceae bacterium]